MRDDGRTVLLTTHDLEEAELLCDRVAIIDRGRIVATGVPRELTTGSTAMPTVSVSTTPALPSGWLDGIQGLEGLTYEAVSTRFRTSRLSDALAGILANAASRNAEVSELHVQRATLEDVVIELTSSARDR
jgi:ABC-2 type transport system ATP-binding protein